MNNSILKIESNTVNLANAIKLNSKTLNGKFISGFQLLHLRIRMRMRLLGLIINSYSNPIDWIKALKYLITLRKNILGTPKIKKLVKVNGKYYMGIYTSAWFSKDFDQFIYSRLNDYKPLKKPINRFDMVFISVTNKCPLKCEHCYDWNQLNSKGKESKANLTEIVEKLEKKGVSHIQFLGGEPLIEYKKICEVVKSSKKNTNFWITTSGYSLNKNKAKALKSAGITGIIVSLDHYDSNKHNRFRNHKDAFNWVTLAVKNALNAKLIVALSICVTREFLTLQNLNNYMNLAKSLGVSYVQVLEPKPVGHYDNKDVLLKEKHILELEQFFLIYNFKNKYKDYPIIIYPGYHQRREGCMLSGKKSIYIDTDGNMNPCPFCHKSYGKVLDINFDSNLEKLVFEGCKDKSLAN